MEFTIKNTEIIDNTVTDENGQIQPSEISVRVDVEINKKTYILEYQTTTTYDYGAYSSNLAAYDEYDDYDSIAEMFENEEEVHALLLSIKEESRAQELWEEYVKEKYLVDDDYFGGMDANSEINKATKR